MLRDDNLIKHILLTLRDTDNPKDIWIDMVIKKYEPETIEKHLKLLHEKGYIDAIDASSINEIKLIPQRLTSAGHDYLESISISWVKKIWGMTLNASGKMVWLVVGGFLGSSGTFVAAQLFNVCK